MRDLACDNRGAQIPFRPVVGRLDAFLGEKRQDTCPVVLRADSVQQALIVCITENAVPEVESEFVPEFLHLLRLIRHVQFLLLRPQRQRLLQQFLQPPAGT
jgi:hypothetical protein